MTRLMSNGVTAIVLVLAAHSPAAAQESFSNVRRAVRAGDTVYVTDSAGAELRGRVVDVGTSTLRIDVNSVEHELTAADVREVRRRGDSVKNGLTIGAITGAAIGAAGGLALSSLLMNEGHDALGPFAFLVGVGAGAGAGVGAGFDALITGRTVVYRRPGQALVFAPLVSPAMQGARLQSASESST